VPKGFDDPVRAYQLPTSTPAQIYLSQFNLGSNNTPIHVTPGFGGGGGSNTPQIKTGTAHFDETVTFYMDQAAVEAREA